MERQGLVTRPRVCSIILTFLPNDCKQITTEFKFWRSHKSTDWKVSCTGTPKALAASKKALMFSMHLNAILLSLTFLTVPGWRALASLQRITPSLRTSKKLSMSPDVLMGSPVTSLIHSRDSAASSSLYFELICGREADKLSQSSRERQLITNGHKSLVKTQKNSRTR